MKKTFINTNITKRADQQSNFDVGYFASYNDDEKKAFKQFLRNVFPQESVSDVRKETIVNAPGVYSHNSYRSDKSDVAPLPELIDTLAVVGYEARNIGKQTKGKTQYG